VGQVYREASKLRGENNSAQDDTNINRCYMTTTNARYECWAQGGGGNNILEKITN